MDHSKEVLVKITLVPWGNYSGPLLVDYRLMSERVAMIIKNLTEKYDDHLVGYYKESVSESKLGDFQMEFFSDDKMVNAFRKISHIINSSYYLCDLLLESLCRLATGNEDNQLDLEPTDEKEIMAYADILHLTY
jgi:hypothetical protein